MMFSSCYALHLAFRSNRDSNIAHSHFLLFLHCSKCGDTSPEGDALAMEESLCVTLS